jgi:hypothetical protein
VHAITEPLGELRPAARERLDELRVALAAHGFAVEVERVFWRLTATHAADTRGPRRSCRVQLGADQDDALSWYWRPGGIDELTQIAPAEAVSDVAETIARTLDKDGDR